MRVDGAIGLEMWRTDLDGGLNVFDEINSVALDGALDVVGAGRSSTTPAELDATVWKLDGTTGAVLWPRGSAAEKTSSAR
ncbi:MAG: hypothetical protein P8R42_21505 [Candidatus Binatia bacterium]|nr:hypothetical protein [Candidatus Binatia bacterium]